jgi:AhpD family alkylhydroperoxidase
LAGGRNVVTMATNYLELRNQLDESLTQLGKEIPGPMTGFARLHRKGMEDGALSGKVKELMALAISIVVGCEGCIAYHVHDAIQAGATRQELLETAGVGLLMGGGPGSIYAAHALEAIDQMLPALEREEDAAAK